MTRMWNRFFIGGTDEALEVAESNPFKITTVIILSREPVHVRRDGVNYQIYSCRLFMERIVSARVPRDLGRHAAQGESPQTGMKQEMSSYDRNASELRFPSQRP